MTRIHVTTLTLAAAMLAMLGPIETADAGSRFGGGIHYLRTVGDLKDVPEWDPDAVSLIGSYQYRALLVFEADVEWMPNYGGTNESMIQPQAWVLIGDLIYGGGGIGIGYFDKAWQDNPFYALRVGVNLRLFSLNADVFATYRFQSTQALEMFQVKDLNSLTLGAVVRFGK